MNKVEDYVRDILSRVPCPGGAIDTINIGDCCIYYSTVDMNIFLILDNFLIDNYETEISQQDFQKHLKKVSDTTIYSAIPEATRHLYGTTPEEIVANYLKEHM